MKTFLNISYGSNLHPVRLRRRCPSARVVGAGRRDGWHLAFHKRGKDGSAKCDAVRTGYPGDHLWVAVFEIEQGEKTRLDVAEGLGHGYDEEQVPVTVAGVPRSGAMYVARDEATAPALRPYDWYHAMVLGGARFHGFPERYLERIGAVAPVPDPHPGRAADSWDVVGEMEQASPSPDRAPARLLL